MGSATKRTAPGTSFSIRAPHAASSSRENALSSESIGTRCSTGANVDTGAPTRKLRGRVGGDELGVLALELAQLAHERVELRVGHLGRVEHEVLLVVVLDQLPELLDAELRRALVERGLGDPSLGSLSWRGPRRGIYRRLETGRIRTTLYAPMASLVATP